MADVPADHTNNSHPAADPEITMDGDDDDDDSPDAAASLPQSFLTLKARATNMDEILDKIERHKWTLGPSSLTSSQKLPAMTHAKLANVPQ